MLFSDAASLRVVIPARYGSTRLPGKPLLDLAGKPMVVWVYEAVKAALADVDIVVAIDDARIATVLRTHGIQAVMTDAGHESGTDRAAEVARLLRWADQDIVVNVQGDEPLIPADLLRAFGGFCVGRAEFSMATVAVPMDRLAQIRDPNVVKLVLNSSGDAIMFSRSPLPFNRDLPLDAWPLADYSRHVGIYAYRVDVLQRLTSTPPCTLERTERLEQLRALWLGVPIRVMRWHCSPPHGVDTPEDVVRVSALFHGEK